MLDFYFSEDDIHMALITLEEAVHSIVDIHGGIRAASRATGVDKAFISRLLNGHKTAPSEETLNKLGLEAVPLYRVAQKYCRKQKKDYK